MIDVLKHSFNNKELISKYLKYFKFLEVFLSAGSWSPFNWGVQTWNGLFEMGYLKLFTCIIIFCC